MFKDKFAGVGVLFFGLGGAVMMLYGVVGHVDPILILGGVAMILMALTLEPRAKEGRPHPRTITPDVGSELT